MTEVLSALGKAHIPKRSPELEIRYTLPPQSNARLLELAPIPGFMEWRRLMEGIPSSL